MTKSEGEEFPFVWFLEGHNDQGPHWTLNRATGKYTSLHWSAVGHSGFVLVSFLGI